MRLGAARRLAGVCSAGVSPGPAGGGVRGGGGDSPAGRGHHLAESVPFVKKQENP